MRPNREAGLGDDTFFVCAQHADTVERGTQTYDFVSRAPLLSRPEER